MARKMKTMDGNHAAAHASYAYTDVAAIYPITSLDRKYRLQRCSQRQVQQVQFTDLWQQEL